MGVDGLLLVSVNALFAAVLLVAGVTKTVVPQPVRRAVEELLHGSAHTVSTGAVRAFGAVEIAVGLGLLIPAARVAAGVAVIGLGTVFALAGAAGRWRRSALPCGCLGGGPYPLGARNVLVGAAFVALERSTSPRCRRRRHPGAAPRRSPRRRWCCSAFGCTGAWRGGCCAPPPGPTERE